MANPGYLDSVYLDSTLSTTIIVDEPAAAVADARGDFNKKIVSRSARVKENKKKKTCRTERRHLNLPTENGSILVGGPKSLMVGCCCCCCGGVLRNTVFSPFRRQFCTLRNTIYKILWQPTGDPYSYDGAARERVIYFFFFSHTYHKPTEINVNAYYTYVHKVRT